MAKQTTTAVAAMFAVFGLVAAGLALVIAATSFVQFAFVDMPPLAFSRAIVSALVFWVGGYLCFGVMTLLADCGELDQ